MVKRHRTFSAPSTDDVEPLEFDVEFTKKGKKSKEHFDCYPLLQGAVILDFVSASAGEGTEMAGKITDFFQQALVPESAGRFDEMIHNPETVVDMGLLSEIVGWLIEEYTERPTRASVPSDEN